MARKEGKLHGCYIPKLTLSYLSGSYPNQSPQMVVIGDISSSVTALLGHNSTNFCCTQINILLLNSQMFMVGKWQNILLYIEMNNHLHWRWMLDLFSMMVIFCKKCSLSRFCTVYLWLYKSSSLCLVNTTYVITYGMVYEITSYNVHCAVIRIAAAAYEAIFSQ